MEGRAPLSLERFSVIRDGRIAYKLQRPWRGGETHRVMQPIELLARLSASSPRIRPGGGASFPNGARARKANHGLHAHGWSDGPQ
jgi:hypothetical protein